MAKRKRMDQIKAVIRNYLSSGSIKATARQLKMSKNTVREYIRRAEASVAGLSGILDMDEPALEKIFYDPEMRLSETRLAEFERQAGAWLKELKRPGVTRQLLWEEYREAHPGGFGYSQFCEHFRRYAARLDLTLALEHRPAEVLMVDFAGKKLHWVDPESGEVHGCEVLAAVFPFSQYCFCIALSSQSLADFIEGLNQALLFFGCLPQILLSDNLKAYVNRTDRYEPTFTQLCEQLGAHYQLELQATRVAKPKDKASVENAVTQVYRRIYAPLRNEIFHSAQALNEAIIRQVHLLNELPYQKRSGSRKSLFIEHELPRARPLAEDLFEIKKVAKAKVQRNYHVFLGEEKNFYSVPWQYAGKQAEILYTSKNVEIYLDQKRVATHRRLFPGSGGYRYQTREEHMPKQHQEWKKTQGYDAAYFLTEAGKIGPATQWAVQQVLLGRIQESQAYNSCKGILHLGKKYSPQRLEQAALRCQACSKATYGMLKRILQLKLDQQPEEPPVQLSLGLHDNIRGPEYYY